MDTASAINTLRRFNQKATEIEQSKTFKTLLSGSAGIRLEDPETGKPCVEWYGLDNDSLLILASLRFFMLDKDGISLKKMADLYRRLPLPPVYVQQLAEVRDEINQVLDKPIFQYGQTGSVLTYRDLIDRFTYGSVVHMEPEKHEELESWGLSGRVFPQYFIWQAITRMMFGIFYIRSMNEAAIAALHAAESLHSAMPAKK